MIIPIGVSRRNYRNRKACSLLLFCEHAEDEGRHCLHNTQGVEENRLHIRYKIKDEIGACMLSIGEWLTKTANMHADMLGEELDTGTNPRLDTTHSSFGPRPCRRPIDVRREACVEPTPIRQ